MSDNQEKLSQLQQRLDKMVEYQQYFFREINAIQNEIKDLRKSQAQSPNVVPPISTEKVSNEPTVPKTEPQIDIPEEVWQTINRPPQNRERGYSNAPPFSNYQPTNPLIKNKSSLEEFIGKNLFSLIGIIITVIGVAIGAKYAIDNNWISPLTRIVFGYVFAFVLLLIALRLKSKYLTFSAVLLSGAMAMMYFLTLFAYSFYNLISQPSAFVMMLVITAFTVVAAISYNRQVIAHIGLVGAYAVPFLLSEGSGRVDILFSYMTIVNFGIFFVSVKKFWKPLFFTSFIFTWLIYSIWYAARYDSQHFYLALGFLTIFFLTFYLIFAVYKLTAKEDFGYEIIGLILVNAAIFYSFGYQILDGNPATDNLLGFFTIANSILHFLFAMVVYRYRLGGKINFYLPVALSLIFLTMAFPIQTKGNWITLHWTAEALILFALARIKRISVFEYFSYPVMFIASMAMLGEWAALATSKGIVPFYNKYFVTGAFFVLCFGLINWFNRNKNYESSLQKDLAGIAKFILPTVFLFALYNVFRSEIGNYFDWEAIRTGIQTTTTYGYQYLSKNPALSSFNIIWQFNYTMFFLTVLGWVNIKNFKSAALGYTNLVLNAIVTTFFLLIGLYLLSDLRESYLGQYEELFKPNIFYIFIRYISISFVLLLFWTSYSLIKQDFITRYISFKSLLVLFDLGFYFSLWIIVTSELLHWMDIFSIQNSYKLGLSILWGIYSLFLIVLGIFQNKIYLRVMAIALFAVTLMKLFLYDIVNLGTIPKTIIFISLGILLLIIAFLYNKFKDLIFEKRET